MARDGSKVLMNGGILNRLRRALLAGIALSLASASDVQSQTGTWVLIGRLDDTTTYLDSTINVTSDPAIIEVFVRSTFAHVVVERGTYGFSYDSRIQRYRIDCSRSTWMHRESRYYRGASLVRRSPSSVGRGFFRPLWAQGSLVIQTACRMSTIGREAAESTFQSVECRIAFAHPVDWEVVRDTSDGAEPCRFTVRSRDWQQLLAANDSVDVHTIFVMVFSQGVGAQLEESPFRRRDNSWIVLGRHDLEAPADSVSGQGWTGLRATAPQGCYRSEGGYAGLCEQPTALVGSSDRSVLIIAGPRAEDTFDRMLATLQFHVLPSARPDANQDR